MHLPTAATVLLLASWAAAASNPPLEPLDSLRARDADPLAEAGALHAAVAARSAAPHPCAAADADDGSARRRLNARLRRRALAARTPGKKPDLKLNLPGQHPPPPPPDPKAKAAYSAGQVAHHASALQSIKDKQGAQPAVQKAAKAALQAGAHEAFRVRTEPGTWQGEKGKRIATAAIGAGGIDAAADRTPGEHGKRRLLESVVGGLAGNRLIHGAKEGLDVRRRALAGRAPGRHKRNA